VSNFHDVRYYLQCLKSVYAQILHRKVIGNMFLESFGVFQSCRVLETVLKCLYECLITYLPALHEIQGSNPTVCVFVTENSDIQPLAQAAHLTTVSRSS